MILPQLALSRLTCRCLTLTCPPCQIARNSVIGIGLQIASHLICRSLTLGCSHLLLLHLLIWIKFKGQFHLCWKTCRNRGAGALWRDGLLLQQGGRLEQDHHCSWQWSHWRSWEGRGREAQYAGRPTEPRHYESSWSSITALDWMSLSALIGQLEDIVSLLYIFQNIFAIYFQCLISSSQPTPPPSHYGLGPRYFIIALNSFVFPSIATSTATIQRLTIILQWIKKRGIFGNRRAVKSVMLIIASD